MLVSVFRCFNELEGRMRCGGLEESVAFRRAEPREGKARDVACVSRELGCV